MVERQEEARGGRTCAGEELAERSAALPSPRSTVASKQGNVPAGAEAEHTLGHART
jgi:hypothetical protein